MNKPRLFFAAVSLMFGGCHTKTAKTADAPAPGAPVNDVGSQRSKSALLELKAELRDDGVLLHIGGIPAGATLECELDNKPLLPCHDGALFARPADGVHQIHAIAIKDRQTVAIGNSPSFSITSKNLGATISSSEPNAAPK